MEYYNIEIFKGSPTIITEPSPFGVGKWETPLYDLLVKTYSKNDRYFLKRLHNRLKGHEQLFYKVLFKFYLYYSGSPLEWIENTMNITYVFDDPFTDHWLIVEREHVIDKKPTATQYVIANWHKIENRKGFIKEAVTAITQQADCPCKDSTFDRIRKEIQKDML